ncbi:hypothetical protein GOBAR_DD14316 [Gossypium barbadense]|nr:hypothetical protein GOBAR_DD14316 [Gossypium barbadense]
MQQLFQEAEERASSAGNEPTPQITLNTKVDMRFNVKQAYWLSDRIRERIMQMGSYKEPINIYGAEFLFTDHVTVSFARSGGPGGQNVNKKNGGVLLQEDDIVVSNVRIDLTRGRQNPLERYSPYPGVVNSKFEHSLGVYWLAGEAIQKLKTYQGLELGIDRFDVLAVKVEQVDIN